MDDFPLPGLHPGRRRGGPAGRRPGILGGLIERGTRREDGTFVIAYRVRTGHAGRGSTVVARSEDGEQLTTVAHLDQRRFGADSMERPAIVRTDESRWRLYVCCATPAPSKHWWIDVLEADDPAHLAAAEARTVFPGDEHTGVKDPIVQRTPDGGWQAWICCHPLDEREEEDRMTTAYATSTDGLEWDWHGTVLEPRPGTWDERGARLTAMLPDGRAAYDGRATKEQNFSERTGLAHRRDDGRIEQTNSGAAYDARYLDVLPLPGGGYRIWYEARLPDESHELRTELIGKISDSSAV